MPSLRIKLEGYTNQKGEELICSSARSVIDPIIHHSQSSSPTSKVNADSSLPGVNEAPHLPVKDQETGEAESIDTLKE
jgi:hypothetical protein